MKVKKFSLILFGFICNSCFAQDSIVIRVDNSLFRWNEDTSYCIYATVRNNFDSNILIMHRRLAFSTNVAFPSEFSLSFIEKPELNYKSGPESISAPQFWSYDSLAPGETKVVAVIIHSMIFKGPSSYKIKLRYSLMFSEGEIRNSFRMFDSNEFKIEFCR